jgi:uncharacterized protein
MRRMKSLLLRPLLLGAVAWLLMLHSIARGGDALTVCPPPAPEMTEKRVADALKNAQDRGFLWRLDKGGRTSWLYGTLHVAKPEWAMPGPTVRGALKQSDALLLELDLTDPKTLAAISEGMSGTATPTLAFSERQRLQVEALALELCIPLSELRNKSPAVQSFILMASIGRREGLHPELGIDLWLGVLARALTKPVISLETVEDQLNLLNPLVASSQAQEQELDRMLDTLVSGRSQTQLGQIAAYWSTSDLAALHDYPQWCECMQTPEDRRAMQRALDDRNVPMTERIAKLHDGGQQVFAAVGALHMVGPQSLPRLLALQGFTVKWVPPKP